MLCYKGRVELLYNTAFHFFFIPHFMFQLSLSTLRLSGKTWPCNVLLNSTKSLYMILSTLGFFSQPFSSITRCQSREAFATEPLTCHSGHWRPINENPARDFLLYKRLWREAEAITLLPGVFFTEKDSYCHNTPASSCSAPQPDKRLFDPPASDYSRYFIADILAFFRLTSTEHVWKIISCFNKCWSCLINC